MRRFIYSRQQLLLISLLLLVSLVAAQCASVPTEPAPVPTEAKATEEAKAVDESAAADNSQEKVAEAQDTEALKATELKGGTEVITDEPDVSTPRTKIGGEYRDVDSGDAVSFHPYTTSDSASWAYQGLVYDSSLLRLDEDTLEYIPNMAEKYTISEDGLTFTFHLRKDIKWSDGIPLTAQDFQWTYEQVVKPENEFPYMDQLEFITSYKALDEYTLEIKIDKIYAPALGQMSGLITPLPKHVWEKLDWSDAEKNPEINSPSVVSGPYKLVEWKRDQFAVFEANKNYWYHGSPNITRHTVEIVPDDDIAFEKMKSGESDTAYVSPEKLEEAKKIDKVNVYEWWSPAASWSYVAYNLREGFPTSDIKVRHAINYAVDKDLLTEEVMVGQGKRMCSVYPDTLWVYTPDVPCYEYNPEKAIELMKEAGYTFKDGKMLDKKGEQLKLKFIYGPNTSKVRELIALTVQDYLAEIGIEVEIQALEWASFLEAKSAEKPDWDMLTGTWGGVLEPHIMFSLWTEDAIPDLNPSAYINKKLEAVFEEAGGTYDTEIRKAKYQEAQKILAEDSPYMFLFYSKSRSAQNKRIQGIEPKIVGIDWNSNDWYITEQERP